MTQAIDNFLPKSIADAVSLYVSRAKWSYGWRSNHGMGYAHWNHDIAKAGSSNGLDVESRVSGAVRDAWDFIKSEHLPDHTLIRCYANAHTYGVEGYPHTDSMRDHDTTVVIYMNREWRREWGGETVIYEGDKIEHAQVPAFNRALIFNGNKWHCARGVTRICPEQRKTIMFKAAKKNADIDRDNLQRFLERHDAGDLGHKNGNLQHHLLITYDLLRKAGLPLAVCLAGGSHSVFGTNAFKHVCVDPAQRDELIEVIGLAATEIVELFGKIDRPKTLVENIGKDGADLALSDGGVVRVTKLQLDALVAIECANLQEQNELHKISVLSKYWKERTGNDLPVYGG